jgi:hypothetical protein
MIDALEMMSNAQDLSQVVGSYLSDKSIDLWNGARQTTVMGNTPKLDFGTGNNMELVVKVIEAFVGATATVMVELITADDEGLTSNVTSILQAPGGSITVGIPVATLIAGYEFRIALAPLGLTQRFLGMRYRIFTATTTAGTISAWLDTVRSNAPGLSV